VKRKRGYTLIEISVVLVVLVVFSALIVPNVIRMGPQQQQRALYGSLLDFARQARQGAIETGQTYALAFDSAKSEFVMRREPSSTAATQSNTTLPAPAGRPLANVQSVSDLEDVKDLPLPSGIQANSFRVGTDSPDASSWLIHFYPDGTSDAGGVELTPGGTNYKSLVITADGLASVVDGSLPDPSDQTWTAGTYAQKI
jgi:prepilin-type N-terminal cleavage/methylation domain-containing protein